MRIVVVIPFYNEESHIFNTLKDVLKYKVKVVVVDDGSTDDSHLEVQKYRSPNLRILRHKVNLGKGAAMKTGADYAFSHGADAVVFMDGDSQHRASDLPKFIDLLESGKFGVIFGSRNFNYGVPLVRFIGNKFASMVIAVLFRIYISDVICGYRAITKKAYSRIKWDSQQYGVETEMVVRTGIKKIKFCEVPVDTIYYDDVKGVTMLDAFGIMAEVIKWRLTL